ncbi:MAG: zf-TFIIB domain-containing protein [Phycisphaerae bacterium]|nr:zf-TFIIB domain-containing protein [Phycisphaerae bacterium]
MYCPKCRTFPLKQATVKEGGGVAINYCKQCKGFWLEKGEFEKVSPLAIKDLSLPAEAKKVLRVCPACQELMFEFYYPQTYVTVEMCKSCEGLWVDAGELKEIETVRDGLKSKGKFQEYDDVCGIKGALLNFIDKAINTLQAL